jgi:hypothetical protein
MYLLLQNAKYEGCTSNDEVIKNLWIVLAEFSVEQKKAFLSKQTQHNTSILVHIVIAISLIASIIISLKIV